MPLDMMRYTGSPPGHSSIKDVTLQTHNPLCVYIRVYTIIHVYKYKLYMCIHFGEIAVALLNVFRKSKENVNKNKVSHETGI